MKILLKRMIKFKDLQEFARENAYTVKKIKSKCFAWKKNDKNNFEFCSSVKDTLRKICFDIQNNTY